MSDSASNKTSNSFTQAWNTLSVGQRLFTQGFAAFVVLSFFSVILASNSSKSTVASSPSPAPSETVVKPTLPPVVLKWNDASEKAALEASIMEGSTNDYGGSSETASVKCEATSQKNIWNCDIRDLGDETPTPYRIEYANGTWAGKPIY